RRVVARHPLGLHVTRQARRLARRLASHTGDARLPALHRGDFGLRSRASLTGIASGSVTASSSRPGRSARRAGSRTSRGGGYKPPPRDATPRSAAGGVRTTPFVSKAGIFLLRIANRSQELNSACTKKFLRATGARPPLVPSPRESGERAQDSANNLVRVRGGTNRPSGFKLPLTPTLSPFASLTGRGSAPRLRHVDAPHVRQ